MPPLGSRHLPQFPVFFHHLCSNYLLLSCLQRGTQLRLEPLRLPLTPQLPPRSLVWSGSPLLRSLRKGSLQGSTLAETNLICLEPRRGRPWQDRNLRAGELPASLDRPGGN